MEYQLTSNASIIRLSDNVFIPSDYANTDYIAYLEWLKLGNVPKPADPLPTPPVLTPAQKLANAGLTVDELKNLLGIS
jgi:hypothetical protein